MQTLRFAAPWGIQPGMLAIVERLLAVAKREGIAAEGEIADRLPGEPGSIVLPAADDNRWSAPAGALERHVLLSSALAGTASYESAVRHPVGARFDLHHAAARRMAQLGIRARVIELGRDPSWGRPSGSRERCDLAVVCRFTPRRAALIAGLADSLSDLDLRVELIAPEDPAQDLALALSGARLTLHLHADIDRVDLSWPLALTADAVGSALLSEHVRDVSDLRSAGGLATAGTGRLGPAVRALLDDDTRIAGLLAGMRAALVQRPTLSDTVRNLVQEVSRVAEPSAVPEPALDLPMPEPVVDRVGPSGRPGAAGEKRRRLEDIASRRAADRASHGGKGNEVLYDSRGAAGVSRVSVLMTVYNHVQYVREALDGLLEAGVDFELIVVDDASTDGSAEAVRGWLEQRPHLSALVVGHVWNKGLPEARNTALANASAGYSFIHDSDNRVLPRSLARLASALDHDQRAAFAYGPLAMLGPDGPVGLRSWRSWAPAALAEENPVDAMAMVRTEALRSVGGYVTDDRLHGWEDYDLWCSLADRGLHGVRVPHVVGVYRVLGGSMLSLVDLSHEDAWQALAERHPGIGFRRS